MRIWAGVSHPYEATRKRFPSGMISSRSRILADIWLVLRMCGWLTIFVIMMLITGRGCAQTRPPRPGRQTIETDKLEGAVVSANLLPTCEVPVLAHLTHEYCRLHQTRTLD